MFACFYVFMDFVYTPSVGDLWLMRPRVPNNFYIRNFIKFSSMLKPKNLTYRNFDTSNYPENLKTSRMVGLKIANRAEVLKRKYSTQTHFL